MVVPLWVRFVLAGIVVASLAAAFWGRPPRRRPKLVTWRCLATAAALCYAAGCGALLLDEAALSAAFVGMGVESLSVAAWLGRSLDDDSDGDGGGGNGHDPSDRDGGAPGDGWRPEDDRAFRDHVARRERDCEPVPG
ncbi:MAG: hypothetical protein M3Z33_04135 [Actinomycetota bacterium]|nr:hypothetical protein [Actinomycetota bacterium]